MSTTASAAGSREIFRDQRGSSRVLRLSWHPEHRLVVFSLWSSDVCLSSFRLPADQVPAFVHVLTSGPAALGASPPVPVPRDGTTATPPVSAPRDGTIATAPVSAPRDGTTATAPDEPGTLSRPPGGDARVLVVGGLTRVLDGVVNGCTRLRTHLDRTGRGS